VTSDCRDGLDGPYRSADGIDELLVAGTLKHHEALGRRDWMRAPGGSIQYESWLDDDDRAAVEALVESAAG
jgi:hypothetical protein